MITVVSWTLRRPAGVQLGHYLHKAGRDYVTLERNPAAASWFSKFPVHRQLNSLNRRNTRESNIEFNCLGPPGAVKRS